MRINFFEKALLNNPVRGWIFRNLEARRLLEAGGKTRGGLALEGRFYIEEILEKYIVHPVFRRLLDHPQQDRFDHYTFKKALQQTGFTIVYSDQFRELYTWFVADKPI